VPLNGDAIAVLANRTGINDQWVFTYNGYPIKRISGSAWYRGLKRAGIENFRWHDLRHTWASWHAQSGTPLSVLQELGGWATPQMVGRYAHLSVEHFQPHADRIFGRNLAQSEKMSFF
jgi:integrase